MQLYKHQSDIIQDDKKKVGLFLGTGSGKSLITLHMAKGKVLCITPKLQKEEENFKREAKKQNIDIDITSISKETFRRDWEFLGQFDTVIIDECHTVSGSTPSLKWVKGKAVPKCSQLYDSLIEYLEKYPPKRLYLLTATPIRTPMSVWGLGRILGKKWDFYKFRDIFYIRVKRGYHEFFIAKSDKETKERLGRIVRGIGYTGQLSDYFDVPEQTYKTVYVDLTTEQVKRLKEIEIEFPDPLVLIGKKHQIENGVLKGDEFSESHLIDDNKTDVIKELALEFPKMIIFARYTMQIKKIEGLLQRLDYKVLTLTGSTKNREGVIKEAEKSEACILVIQAQISAGYELPSFPVVVYA